MTLNLAQYAQQFIDDSPGVAAMAAVYGRQFERMSRNDILASIAVLSAVVYIIESVGNPEWTVAQELTNYIYEDLSADLKAALRQFDDGHVNDAIAFCGALSIKQAISP